MTAVCKGESIWLVVIGACCCVKGCYHWIACPSSKEQDAGRLEDHIVVGTPQVLADEAAAKVSWKCDHEEEWVTDLILLSDCHGNDNCTNAGQCKVSVAAHWTWHS